MKDPDMAQLPADNDPHTDADAVWNKRLPEPKCSLQY